MARKDITQKDVLMAYATTSLIRRLPNLPASMPMPSFLCWPDEFLALTTKQPLKVCIRAIERELDNGLIDFGVSLRAGFLTDGGKEKLKSYFS
jgi:hypothetical protein